MTEVTEILGLPFGWQRNLALRQYLGLRDGELGKVTFDDVIEVTVFSKQRALQLSEKLEGSEIHDMAGRWQTILYPTETE